MQPAYYHKCSSEAWRSHNVAATRSLGPARQAYGPAGAMHQRRGQLTTSQHEMGSHCRFRLRQSMGRLHWLGGLTMPDPQDGDLIPIR